MNINVSFQLNREMLALLTFVGCILFICLFFLLIGRVNKTYKYIGKIIEILNKFIICAVPIIIVIILFAEFCFICTPQSVGWNPLNIIITDKPNK
jgi:hypothetical protein